MLLKLFACWACAFIHGYLTVSQSTHTSFCSPVDRLERKTQTHGRRSWTRVHAWLVHESQIERAVALRNPGVLEGPQLAGIRTCEHSVDSVDVGESDSMALNVLDLDRLHFRRDRCAAGRCAVGAHRWCKLRHGDIIRMVMGVRVGASCTREGTRTPLDGHAVSCETFFDLRRARLARFGGPSSKLKQRTQHTAYSTQHRAQSAHCAHCAAEKGREGKGREGEERRGEERRAQHSTAQHSTAQHSTAQHSTAQHSTAQQRTTNNEQRTAQRRE